MNTHFLLMSVGALVAAVIDSDALLREERRVGLR
jgi:hypothetical protein